MLRRLALPAALAFCGLATATPRSVFEASPAWPAPFVERIGPTATARPVLRTLVVEERVGEPRSAELVRVPLFLHEDEPNAPAQWSLYAESDAARTRPIAFQTDDLRFTADGRLARCHLFFPVDLEPWERRRFVLLAGPALRQPETTDTASCRVADDRVTLSGADLSVTFLVRGPRAGAIVALHPRTGPVSLPGGWLGPRLELVRQSPDCAILGRATVDYADPGSFEVREVRWGAGPLFAKFSVRIGPPGRGDAAEFTYRVPFRGTTLVQTERLAPEGDPTAEVVGADDHLLLAGRLRLGTGGETEVRPVPAGLRGPTRATSGHTLTALVSPADRFALLTVPAVQTAGGAITAGRGDDFSVAGPSTFRRHKEGHSATLRAFWGEMRYVFTPSTDGEALWHEARRAYQPLVAIVDEPTLGAADCRAAMPAVAQRFLEIPYWGRQWPQEAALLWMKGDRDRLDALLANRPSAAEAAPAFHLPKWARPDPPLPRDPKDQGRIDPYHLAYGSSVLPLFARLAPSPKFGRTAHAIGLAARRAFGRVNDAGSPYVDCFATALNMQLGPLGLALFGARETGDPALAAWALDALHSPSVTALYGHGQRAYPGELRSPAPSDFLYECISDFHLRSLELATGEDLWVHPAALGRYLDCVDVTADLQHRPPSADPTAKSWDRANFFRGQAHDHRWENWSAAPLLGLFATREEIGQVGCTEAAYWLEWQGRSKQSWAELLWFAHTDLLLALRDRLPPPQPAPMLPADLSVRRDGAALLLRWSAVPGAAGYRVYRARQPGGPWAWLNSPYAARPAAPLTATGFRDPDGREGDSYLVTAVDAAGRESRWYDDEPRR